MRTRSRAGRRGGSTGRNDRVLATVLTLALSQIIPLTGPAAQNQPPTDIHGVIEGKSAKKIPIAVVPIAAATTSLAAIAREMHQALMDDLVFARYFDVIDPSAFSGIPVPVPESTNLSPWRSTGAEAVLVPKLFMQGGKLAIEGRLYDTASSEMVLGKRYGGETDLARRIAHRLANDVIAHFTGQPGVALSRIAFVSTAKGGKEVYVMDYDGYRLHQLTTTGSINLSPAWSADATRLAFLSFRQKFPSLFILEADGTITRIPTGGGDLNSAPDWSPDGTRLAYSSTRDGNCEIYVMDNVQLRTGSHREHRLTDNRGIDSSPSWSPTGREIAFTSDRGGSPQLYVMDSEGGNVRRLTFDGRRNDSPAWSPKGDKIAYVSRIEGKFALMVFDIEAQRSSILLSGPFNCEDPRWSFDGRHLTFASDKEGHYDIYTIDADGMNVRRLTKGVPSFTPDWSR